MNGTPYDSESVQFAHNSELAQTAYDREHYMMDNPEQAEKMQAGPGFFQSPASSGGVWPTVW